MINDLIKLANHFDKSGLYKEANFLDRIIKKFSDKSRILPITVGDVGLENEELDNVNLDAEEKFKLVYKDTAKNEVLSRPCKSWEETKKEYNKIEK